MATAEYQRERRKRLKASGGICRLQVEMSSEAGKALWRLTHATGKPARTILEPLIMEAARHAGV